MQSLAAAAVHAVGIRDAVTHTEVKLTRDGPRIIEMNGRAGGHVFDLVPRVSGVSLVGNQKLALVRGLAKDHEQLRLLLAAIAGTLVSTYREFPLESLAPWVQAATDCESAC